MENLNSIGAENHNPADVLGYSRAGLTIDPNDYEDSLESLAARYGLSSDEIAYHTYFGYHWGTFSLVVPASPGTGVMEAMSSHLRLQGDKHVVRFGLPNELMAVNDIRNLNLEQYTAIDLAKYPLDRANLVVGSGFNDVQTSFIHADARATELADESVDVVTSEFFLEGMEQQVAIDIMREAGRILRPDGQFILKINAIPRRLAMGQIMALKVNIDNSQYQGMPFDWSVISQLDIDAKADLARRYANSVNRMNFKQNTLVNAGAVSHLMQYAELAGFSPRVAMASLELSASGSLVLNQQIDAATEGVLMVVLDKKKNVVKKSGRAEKRLQVRAGRRK